MHVFQQTRPTPRCFGGNTVKALSITQVVCGALAMLLGIGILIPGSSFSVTGYPIWTGAMFLSTGIIGIYAAKRKNPCMIIPLMVMSILSAILSGSITTLFASFALGSGDVWGWCRNFSYYDCPAGVLITLDVALIVLGLLEMGLAISTAVMSCYAICPGCSEGNSESCCACSDNSSGYQSPAVAYQVGADGRLVQIPGQFATPGGQPIAMTPFPPGQLQQVANHPSGATAQQPLLVTQAPPTNVAAAQGSTGVGQTPKPQGNVVMVPAQSLAAAPQQHLAPQPMSTVGHGNIQFVLASSTPIPQAATQQPPQLVPQVQFQQPNQAVSSPYHPPPQLQQQPSAIQEQPPAPPTGSSPPPSYQPEAPVDADQVSMPTDRDNVPLIEN